MTDTPSSVRKSRTPAAVAPGILLALLATAHCVPAAADLSAVSRFNIVPQPLQAAIVRFTEQSGVQVTSPAALFKDRRSAEVVGDFTPAAALTTLLSGTDLSYQIIDSNTIVIVLPRATTSSAPAPASGNYSANHPASAGQVERLARTDATQNPQAAQGGVDGGSPEAEEGAARQSLQEIVVTAQKRAERIQDVPVPVFVIKAESLVAQNQLLLQDYVAKVPGFSLLQAQGGQQILALRGITTGIANPAVGISVDDVPFGSASIQGGGLLLPDIDPDDLAHIEVLRGPQGTLYGASSIGGLLKFVTADPSTSRMSGRLQMGASTISHGSDVGYNVRGMVNVPLTDTAALRASAFTREDPGYIDNPFTGARDLNTRRVSGGRVAFLWRPSDAFSLKLSALVQESKSDGSDAVIAGTQGLRLSDFAQDFLPDTGWFRSTTEAYSAIATARLGSADLVAVTGYTRSKHQDAMDFSKPFGPLTQDTFGVTSTPFHEDGIIRRLTQEIRLTLPVGPKAQWLLGGFYSHEQNSYLQTIWAAQTSGELLALALRNSFPTELIDHALFTDLTYQFTDRFDVQIGARENWNKQNFDQYDTGPWTELFFGSPAPLTFHVRSSENAATYLLTPRFKLSPDLMLYARLASGFRPGGPNFNVGAPPSYQADRTLNYEAGIKGSAFDRALSFDASLYYIDWKDIQLFLATLGTPSIPYTGNGSRAKSQGVELSVEASPRKGLTVSVALSLNEAELTRDLPPESVASGGYGLAGDRLPGSARFTGNVSINQQFPLGNDLTAFVGGSLGYVGGRLGAFAFNATSTRARLPSYSKLDANIGIQSPSWTVSLYANNITDRTGVIGGGGDSVPSEAFYLVTPRIVGLNVIKQF